MRKFIVGLSAGLAALVGFAGSSSASATIDLLWATSGTSVTNVSTSSTSIVLNVILTAGPAGSAGAGISVDYSTALPGLALIGYANTPGGPLPINLGVTTNTGTRLQNVNSGALPPYVGTGLAGGSPGQSWQIGSLTFNAGGAGSWSLTTDANGPTDGVLDLAGGNISGTSTFNGATFNVAPVPEPGTLSLLGMGLGGLYVVGRRSRRKR